MLLSLSKHGQRPSPSVADAASVWLPLSWLPCPLPLPPVAVPTAALGTFQGTGPQGMARSLKAAWTQVSATGARNSQCAPRCAAACHTSEEWSAFPSFHGSVSVLPGTGGRGMKEGKVSVGEGPCLSLQAPPRPAALLWAWLQVCAICLRVTPAVPQSREAST